jgi:hypothetical protein
MAGGGDVNRFPPRPSRPLQLAAPDAASEAGHLTKRMPMAQEKRREREKKETRREASETGGDRLD